MPRTYDEELKFIERINSYSWRIKKGFVPNMNVCKKNEISNLYIYIYLFEFLLG
jgi:hypothetical protein